MTNIPKFQAFTNLYNGSYVILGKNSKIPVNSGWQKAGISKEEALKAAEKGFNIGVLLNESDFIVDFDTKNYKGDDVEAYVQEFLDEFGVEDALTTKTISGGLHIYLKKEADTKISRYVKDRWEDIVEFKTQGSQVLAPGCTIGDGEYTILRGSKPQIAPKSLIDIVEKKYSSTANSGAVIVSLETIKQHLDLVDPADLAREEWLNIGMAVHSGCEGSEEGMALWVDWGRRDERYDTDREAAQSEKTWHGFTDGPINFHRIKKAIKDHGGKIPSSTAKDDFAEIVVVDGDVGDSELIALERSLQRNKNDEPVVNTVNSGLVLRFFMQKTGIYLDINDHFIKFDGGLPWAIEAKTWSDNHEKAFHEYIACKGYELPETRFTSAFKAAQARPDFQKHPIRESLNALTWDGIPRLDTWLTKYTGCDDNPYTQAVGAYLIKALVKRAFHPGCKADYMPILEGNQGAQKSALCKVLASPWDSDEDPLTVNNKKDMAMVIEGKWLIELPELSTFAKKDPNTLKAFVTKTHDRFRRPYSSVTEDVARGCVLIGTTNDQFYLQDTTGNRRFMPVQTKEYKIKELSKVRDQIFAEAMSLYETEGHKDEFLMFSNEVIQVAKVKQESRRVVSDFEESIRDFIQSRVAKGITFISIDDIKRELKREFPNRAISSQTMLRYFDAIGWEWTRKQVNGSRARGFAPGCDGLADFLG